MNLKNLFTVCCALLLAPLLSALTPEVLVSVSPHQFLVDKIAGGTVHVILLVPAGASGHTYEPTPKQVLAASKARVWFRMGESFEPYILRSLTSYNSSMEVVDLREGVRMIMTSDPGCQTCRCHKTHLQDLHFWLSAREAKVQAETIAKTLSSLFPEHAAQYQTNLQALTAELDQTDKEIIALLEPVKKRTMLVSHPAYAYFVRDYGLCQISIEMEGKDPTPQSMDKLLRMAKELKITQIYAQKQYSLKGAELFAQELGAKLVILDPYYANIPQTLLDIAHALVADNNASENKP